jgi:predicted MFS family arabinose efflux permease
MKALRIRLVLTVSLLLVLAALLLSWLALREFEHDLPPEMARTVIAVSHSAAVVLEKAYDSGVPLEQMSGAPEFFDAVRKDNPGIAYLLLADASGRILYQSGYSTLQPQPDLRDLLSRPVTEIATERNGAYFNTGVPLVFKKQRVATLYLGQQSALIEMKMREISYDIIAVLVVAGLIALELMRFVLTFIIATPIEVMRDFLARVRGGDFSHYLPFDRLGGVSQLSVHFNQIVAAVNQRYQDWLRRSAGARPQGALAGYVFHAPGQRPLLFSSALDHIRWPFFLLIFADSLSLSFFPVFVGQFYTPAMGLSKNLVVGLPISIFMFTWALSMPWAGGWSDRVGHRKAFVVGAAVTTAGLLATACAHSLYDLLVWRSLTALGYGLVFITAQGYIASNTPPERRTRGMAVFLSGFFAGSLSGSAIGGILSDRLGYSQTILLSALLSATSAAFVLRFLHNNPNAGPQRKKLGWRDIRLLLKNRKFLAVTFLAAVPAKIALTGFLYYLAPLYLKLLGNNQSTTGRVMMAYGLAIIVLSPMLAKLADRIGQLRWFVSIGGYAAAAAMFVIYYFDSTPGLLASITLLGVAHAIGVSPQLALINDFCKDVVAEVGSGTVTGIFRLIERLGNILGPIIAGLLISQCGYHRTFLGIGLISACCSVCFTAVFFWFDRHPSRSPSPAR